MQSPVHIIYVLSVCFYGVPSVLWRCWLGGGKGIWPVKKLSGGMLAWLFVRSYVQTCIWPSWCHSHSLSLASVKSRLVLPFWYRLTWIVPDKGPLNGCVCMFLWYVCKKACLVHKMTLVSHNGRQPWHTLTRWHAASLEYQTTLWSCISHFPVLAGWPFDFLPPPVLKEYLWHQLRPDESLVSLNKQCKSTEYGAFLPALHWQYIRQKSHVDCKIKCKQQVHKL